MARVLIVYHTRSGHTEQMAQLIAGGVAAVPGNSVIQRRAADGSVEDWINFDGIIIGSPVYYGGAAAEIKRLIDDSVRLHGRLRGKLGGAFASSANIGGGNETTTLGILQAWLIHGMLIMGDSMGDHYGPVSIEQPDARSIKVCTDYGRLFGETAKRLFG